MGFDWRFVCRWGSKGVMLAEGIWMMLFILICVWVLGSLGEKYSLLKQVEGAWYEQRHLLVLSVCMNLTMILVVSLLIFKRCREMLRLKEKRLMIRLRKLSNVKNFG